MGAGLSWQEIASPSQKSRPALLRWLTSTGCSPPAPDRTAFSPIRVSRASSPCQAPGLELEQGPVPLPEPEPVGTPRLPQRVAEPVQVEPPRPERAPALVLASWTEFVEVPRQDLPPPGS
jgi:hypothetical protein